MVHFQASLKYLGLIIDFVFEKFFEKFKISPMINSDILHTIPWQSQVDGLSQHLIL